MEPVRGDHASQPGGPPRSLSPKWPKDTPGRLFLLLKARKDVGVTPVDLERGLRLLRRERFTFASCMKKQPIGWRFLFGVHSQTHGGLVSVTD